MIFVWSVFDTLANLVYFLVMLLMNFMLIHCLNMHTHCQIGNYEAINCYYAHGEPNSCFQRRSYWMLDP